MNFINYSFRILITWNTRNIRYLFHLEVTKINNPVLSFKSYAIQIIYKVNLIIQRISFKSYAIQIIYKVNLIIQRKIYNYEKTFEPKLDTVLQGLSFQMFQKNAETEKN